MARARRVALTAIVATLVTALGGLVSTGPAAGATPVSLPGTVVLREGVGGQLHVSGQGLTSRGLFLASMDPNDYHDIVALVPVTGGPPTQVIEGPNPIPLFFRRTPACTGGDLVVGASDAAADGTMMGRWWDVTTGRQGTFTTASGTVVLGPAPNGALLAKRSTIPTGPQTELSVLDPRTGVQVALGAVPDVVLPQTCDVTHYAVRGETGDIYVGAFSGGAPTRVATAAGRVAANVGSTVVISSQTEAVLVRPGSQPEVLLTGFDVSGAAVNGDAIALAAGSSGWVKRPGQPAVAVPGANGGNSKVYTVGDGFLWVGTAILRSSGVSTETSPVLTDYSRDQLSLAGPVVAPGRVVWRDNAAYSGSVTVSRAISAVGNLAPEAVMAGSLHATGAVRVDGRRIAADANGLNVDGSFVTASDPGRLVGFSAHRALAQNVSSDLAAGRVTSRRTVVAGWGDRILSTKPGGGYEIRTVSDDRLVRAVDAVGTIARADMQGDLVAWTWPVPSNTSGPTTHAGRWLDLRTGVSGSINDARADGVVSVFGSRLAYVAPTAAGDTIRLVDTKTGAVTDTTARAWAVSLGASGIAWSGPQSPGRTQAGFSPLPDLHLPPRHEGNPIGSASLDARVAGASWRGEWVFTESLTSCRVDVLSAAAAVVRALPCDGRFAALGEAVVDWDGRDNEGSLAPSGWYSMRVVASDGDGSVVDTDGLSAVTPLPVFVSGPVMAPPSYSPVTPARLLDTRAGTGVVAAGLLQAGATLSLQVAGRGGVPVTGVDSVVLNVTATEPTGPGYITAWPAGVSAPLASNLNYVSGQTVANQVVVKVGSGGRVNLVAATSGTHLIADVAGFFATGAPFIGVTPARLADTRAVDSLVGGMLAPNAPRSIPVTGRAGIPPSGVGAAVLNVTVTEPTGPGYLTAYPTGEPRPLASNLNFRPSATVPGMVVATVGRGGQVDLSSPASTHVIADVAGWIPQGAGYEAMVPLRVLDTRDGIGTTAGFVPSNGVVELDVSKVPGLPATVVKAVSLNVTVTQPAAPGYVTVYPDGERPLASNLNYVADDTIANSVIAKVGADGKVRVYATGRTHLVVDLSGYWTG